MSRIGVSQVNPASRVPTTFFELAKIAASGRLGLVGTVASITLITLAAVYRPLVVECFDPGFLRSVGGRGSFYHILFLFLVVLNLVAGFQALGTLMAVGLMTLPASIAQLWARTLPMMMTLAAAVAVLSGLLGLIISYNFSIASGPTIILVAASIYCVSLLLCPSGALRRLFPARV